MLVTYEKDVTSYHHLSRDFFGPRSKLQMEVVDSASCIIRDKLSKGLSPWQISGKENILYF